jgi:hypothetical protein
MVSFAVSTIQVSLSVQPHLRQTTLTVDSCLSDAVFLSMTAISGDLQQGVFVFLISPCFRGFWYLHLGHLSMVPFFAIWSIAPHSGQKFIMVT